MTFDLGARRVPGEALDGERRDIGEGLASEHEVANDLAHRRALEEAVPREPGRIQEAREGSATRRSARCDRA